MSGKSSPWDRNRAAGGQNLLPTIAVGLPITAINTFQHIFLGAVWRPVPAIGLLAARTCGRVDPHAGRVLGWNGLPRWEHWFPGPVTTQLETVTKIGWYVGAVVTDAAFIKLFKRHYSAQEVIDRPDLPNRRRRVCCFAISGTSNPSQHTAQIR